MSCAPAAIAADAQAVRLTRPAQTATVTSAPTEELATLVAEHFEAVYRLQAAAPAPRAERRKPAQILVREQATPARFDTAAAISAGAFPQSTLGGLLATLLSRGPAEPERWIVADAKR